MPVALDVKAPAPIKQPVAAPTRIELPVPFPIRSANAWLLPGTGPLLLDCGVGQDESYAILLREIARAGVSVRDLRLVVTHGHVDHAGNAARLHREHGVLLLAAAAEATYLETFRRDEQARNDAFLQACIAHGMPAPIGAKIRARSHDVDGLTQDVPIRKTVADGQRLAAGDTQVTIHLTPGHTPGSLVVEGDTWLATGDTFLEHITSNAIELLDADKGRYAQYLRTLDCLRRFVGLTALPGHHAPFPITDALIDQHLAKHARRSQRIWDALDRPQSAWGLLPRVLPHLARGDTFLGMCEVVGHLHALELAGRVALDGGMHVRRFRRL